MLMLYSISWHTVEYRHTCNKLTYRHTQMLTWKSHTHTHTHLHTHLLPWYHSCTCTSHTTLTCINTLFGAIFHFNFAPLSPFCAGEVSWLLEVKTDQLYSSVWIVISSLLVQNFLWVTSSLTGDACFQNSRGVPSISCEHKSIIV